MDVPRHVAIIMDGNGRWAKKRGLPRNYGHAKGAENVEIIAEAAFQMGIKYLTLYAFSTENWSRPDDEVGAIMGLMREYLKKCKKIAEKNNMRVRILGERSHLAPDIQNLITDLEEYTANYTGINLQACINYGSRDEITRAVRRLAQDVKEEKLSTDEINESVISSYLDTGEIPDPDLMIRTSGEERLSNYLLWQLAYAEFVFTDVAWPDFSPDELKKALEIYQNRQRRYGNV